MKELIKILKEDNDRAYDWLCQHGYELSYYEMLRLSKELLYAAYQTKREGNISDDAYDNMLYDVGTVLEEE